MVDQLKQTECLNESDITVDCLGPLWDLPWKSASEKTKLRICSLRGEPCFVPLFSTVSIPQNWSNESEFNK